MTKSLIKFIISIIVAAIGLCLLLCAISQMMRPELSAEIKEYSSDEIDAVEAIRDVSFDKDNPIRLHKDVDYSEGESAKWYPKGEAPILAELVKEGKLPPVAERVGQEPCVMEGVDGIGNYGGTWMQIATSMDDINSQLNGRMTNTRLVQWSPQGYPIVPNIAKSYTISDDKREYTFELRKGVKWSDGHPFTADDIMYWWETVKLESDKGNPAPTFMRISTQSRPRRENVIRTIRRRG
jgi:ABC-type transport system substrate-binding protein